MFMCFLMMKDSGILRYQLYNDYKANRDKNYADKINDTSDYMQGV